MDNDSSSNAVMPVICDIEQLDTYLGAWAEGQQEAMLATLQMDRASWLMLAGPDGEAAWAQAKAFGFPLVDMARIVQTTELKKLFPEVAGRRLHATPLLSAHGYLAVAIDAGTDQTMLSMLGFVTNEPVVPVVATTQARLGHSAPQYDRDEDQRVARQMGRDPGQSEEQRQAQADELARKWPMIQTMRSTMAAAIRQRASDVHIRPGATDF